MSQLFDLLKEFDIAALLPEMTKFESQLAGWMRFFLLIGPIVIGALGAVYFYIPPDEANHALGYRSKWSMQSVAHWQHAQKVAGMIYMILGGGLFVLMLILAFLLGLMDPLAMAVTTVVCGLIQVVLIICANLLIEKILRKS